MEKSILKFSLILLFGLSLVFTVHLFMLHSKGLPLFAHKILWAYLLNFLIALGTFITLFRLKEKMKNQLGFIFMGTSLFKFLIFFLVFYPDYSSDQKMSTLEFSAFFVPYSYCLIIEVLALTKMLNKLV